MRNRSTALNAIAVLGAFACSSPDTKECHQQMASAQNIVNGVEGNSLDSVNASIVAIEGAEAACRRAGRSGELKELAQAKDRLTGHRGLLEERAERKKREALTPAQIEKLLHDGDPNCPRGQGYQPKGSTKEIRCIGPQPVEMNWEQAKRYYVTRNFRSIATSDEAVLTMESGAERYVFRFAEKGSNSPAHCITIYPRPGVSWQEAVARNTGVPPEKLKPGTSINVGQAKLLLDVDEKNQIAKLGDCLR
ncbi:MAG TPA: hypothetical protein VIV60_10390 [Polyangiaceae bacterium]